MAHRRPKSRSVEPASNRGAVEGAESFDRTDWARRILSELPDDIPDDERAVLDGQVRALIDQAGIADPLPPDPTAPKVVRDLKALERVNGIVGDAAEVVIDIETSSLDPTLGEIVGVGLATEAGNHYLPVNHRFEDSGLLRPDQLPLDVVMRGLGLAGIPLIAHNAKFEFKWLRSHAGEACTFAWDTMIAARLLRSDQSAELKDVAVRMLDVPDWGMTGADIARVQFLPVERVARYCAKDCRYTLQLYQRQREYLK